MVRCALIHGFAGTPAAWDDVIESWQLPMPPRPIALPGHGGPPVLPTWEENLAAIALETRGCDVVVGYSLGARVALGLVAGGHASHGVLIGVNPGVSAEEREKLVFRAKLQVDPQLLAKYHRQVKTGVRGLGFVRTSPSAKWPDSLVVKLP